MKNKKIQITYAISVCNEHTEIQRLISFLLKNKQLQDTIVVLFDSKNGSTAVEEFLRAKSINGEFLWLPYEFDGHFANMKNKLTSLCDGDYIFNIDADEIPNEKLMENIHWILEENDVEVVVVPRVNTVDGLTETHIQKWRWNVNEKGWVNWPDYQMRIYKNIDKIKWENKVHERLTGFSTISNLPELEEFVLYHPKSIDKQVIQNAYYNTL